MPAPTRSAATIRPASEEDLPALGRLGAALARAHHDWDPQRFFTVDEMEHGYAWWLGRERANRKAVVLVAVRRGRVIGYCYGALQPRDWNALLDRCGVIHDLMIEEKARGGRVGEALCHAMIEALRDRGAPRVVLQTAAKNEGGQRFFGRLGFRPTMIEMTLETPPPPAATKRPRKGAGRTS